MQTTIQTLEYNGWCNRETWLGNLWLTNDEAFYRLFLQAIDDCKSDKEIAEYLEQELRDQLYDEVGSASLWQDLLGTAFDRINWLDIVISNDVLGGEL